MRQRERVYSLIFFAGCLLTLICAVLLFNGSTQVVSVIEVGISIFGFLLNFIQLCFPMPIFPVKIPKANLNNQSSSQKPEDSPPIPNKKTPNLRILPLLHALTKEEQIFFLISLFSIPIITFIKLLDFTDIPMLLLAEVALSAISGVGFTFLFLVIDSARADELFAFLFYLSITIGIVLLILLPFLQKIALLYFLCADIFFLLIPSLEFTLLLNPRRRIDLIVKLSHIIVFIFADLLFIFLSLDSHFFMTVNPNGTFNTSSFSLFAPRGDLVLLTATLFLTFAVGGICISTKAVLGPICGATTLMIGVGLFLFQQTPMFFAVSGINIIIGVIMFVAANSRGRPPLTGEIRGKD